MSEHEKRLRALLGALTGTYPAVADEMRKELDALLAEQRTTGLDEAHDYFEEMAAELRRRAVKTTTPEKKRDMLMEADRAHWAKHKLRSLQGRKTGKEKTG